MCDYQPSANHLRYAYCEDCKRLYCKYCHQLFYSLNRFNRTLTHYELIKFISAYQIHAKQCIKDKNYKKDKGHLKNCEI